VFQTGRIDVYSEEIEAVDAFWSEAASIEVESSQDDSSNSPDHHPVISKSLAMDIAAAKSLLPDWLDEDPLSSISPRKKAESRKVFSRRLTSP